MRQMDLIDHLNQIALRAREQHAHLVTEEATKNALILPFLHALGYDVFNPVEVIPEFTADVAIKKGEKVDYAIKIGGELSVLIECKKLGTNLRQSEFGQLFRYFSVTSARLAILTNGIDFHFFSDLDAPNKMDSRPFFEFSLAAMDNEAIDQLKKFARGNFSLENILSNANQLKYAKAIIRLMQAELEHPSEPFVRHFVSQIYDGPITAKVKDQFSPLVAMAFRDFIRFSVNARLKTALEGDMKQAAPEDPTEEPIEENEEGDKILTTDDEIHGFYIVRAICAEICEPERIVIRDNQSYCGVLFENNNRKPVCRLHFNRGQKYLGVFNREKVEERVPITKPADIYQYAERIRNVVQGYLEGKSSN